MKKLIMILSLLAVSTTSFADCRVAKDESEKFLDALEIYSENNSQVTTKEIIAINKLNIEIVTLGCSDTSLEEITLKASSIMDRISSLNNYKLRGAINALTVRVLLATVERYNHSRSYATTLGNM